MYYNLARVVLVLYRCSLDRDNVSVYVSGCVVTHHHNVIAELFVSLFILKLLVVRLVAHDEKEGLRYEHKRDADECSDEEVSLILILSGGTVTSPHGLPSTAIVLSHKMHTVCPNLRGRLIIVVMIEGACEL